MDFAKEMPDFNKAEHVHLKLLVLQKSRPWNEEASQWAGHASSQEGQLD